MSKVHNRHDKAFTVTSNGISRPVMSHPEFGVVGLKDQAVAPKPATPAPLPKPVPTPKKEKEAEQKVEPENNVEAHETK